MAHNVPGYQNTTWCKKHVVSLPINHTPRFVTDDLAALHLHLLVKPLPVTAALHAAHARAAVETGIEAAHTVRVQAVAHVFVAGEKPAGPVVRLALGSHGLSIIG